MPIFPSFRPENKFDLCKQIGLLNSCTMSFSAFFRADAFRDRRFVQVHQIQTSEAVAKCRPHFRLFFLKILQRSLHHSFDEITHGARATFIFPPKKSLWHFNCAPLVIPKVSIFRSSSIQTRSSYRIPGILRRLVLR